MKNLVLIVLVSSLFAACSARKKGDEITVKVEYREAYCGGAAPPPEMLAELAKVKPLANHTIFVVKESDQTQTGIPYKTDGKGLFQAKLEPGFYAVHFYDVNEVHAFFKSQGGNPIFEPGDCPPAWKLSNQFRIEVLDGTQNYEGVISKTCDPCVEPPQ
jgi:hypothetical protein